MKKFLALLLAALMLLSIVACTNQGGTEKDTTEETKANDTEIKIDPINPPTLTYLYNTSDAHKAIGEYLAAQMSAVGITMNLENQEWNTFLNTRKEGDYSVARNGWVADYNDPICFLDMWTSNSGNNDVQFGKGAHKDLAMYNLDLTNLGYEEKIENGTWAQTYDVLISKIKACTDNNTRYALMHIAEDMLMDTGCLTPLYFYTDLYMLNEKVDGFFSNPLGYKYFMNCTVDGKTDVINVCLASEPDHIDPALNSAVDGATMIAHLFSGLAKWSQDENGKLIIVPDLAENLVEGVVADDGTVTYTYTIREGAKWSDGKELKASDFAYAWNRAANVSLGADYGYMFEVVDGYSDSDENAKLNVTADDEARTLTVTLKNAVAYWNELLAFPVYFPVREDIVADEAWETEAASIVCNGAYTMSAWEHNSVITFTKNPEYLDADDVKMESIKLFLSDDANNMLTNFKNGEWQLIDDVPTAEIPTLKTEFPTEFVVAGQIGTYYVCWNINEDLLPGVELDPIAKELAQQEIRKAIGQLYDRNYIIDQIAQGGQTPASSFVAAGMTDADGSEFYKNSGNGKVDGATYVGYYDVSAEAYAANAVAARETLAKYYVLPDAQ